LEAANAVFAGIEKPEEWISNAKQALDTVANLKDKEIVDAGEVEKIKKGVADSYESRIADISKSHAEALKKATDDLESKDAAIRRMVVEGAFQQSKFLREKTVLLPEFAYNTFGKHFKVEEEGDKIKVSAVDADGNAVFSLKNPGEHAGPEEAIEILISNHPQKDSLLRGLPGGSGTSSSNRVIGNDWKKLSPTERLNYARGVK
jgi:hypothetical protein